MSVITSTIVFLLQLVSTFLNHLLNENSQIIRGIIYELSLLPYPLIYAHLLPLITNFSYVIQYLGTDSDSSLGLPTRVLDVGVPPATGRVKIVETDDLRGSFVALSHSLGSSHRITLTRANYEALRASIAVSDLPETFRDAVFLTRSLGLRYLWIDSLCII